MRAFKILSIEAKDLYGAMQMPNNQKEGYRIRNADGKLRERKFGNTLDWSLDSIQLQDVYEKVTRRKDFAFQIGKHWYTQVVINVKFTYSYKEFNKVGPYNYVRAGYNFQDCQLTDGACLHDGELIAIQTNVDVAEPLPKEVLGKYFTHDGRRYVQVGNIPVLMNKSDLRNYLYKNGFVCDGTRYVRYKRSSGSSRVGKCLFVNSAVAPRMEKWDKCGLTVAEGQKIDLAAWEAYIALPLSSLIDAIEIYPEEILVVPDYESVFEEDVIAVDAPDGKLVSQRKRTTIKNSIWDGQSLLDSSMFFNYQDKGMLVLRNRFFKTCAFNTNIQQWFADNEIYSVSQLKGFTLAEDVSQIKLITTPNSIKYLKFGSIEKWLANIDSVYGIVKHEKATPYFDGRMVQTHYQLINTMQMSFDDVNALLKPSLDYLSLLRSDVDVLRHHIKYAFQPNDSFVAPILNKNDIAFKLLGINNKFAQTKIFKDFRNNLVRSYVRTLKRGHILVRGNYSTLFGNPIEILKAAIGQFDGNPDILPGTIHCSNFEHGEELLGSRSPHITMGNILLVTNVLNPQIERYFNLTDEIVCVNAIDENISQRLNGCDYDSDAMLLTNNKLLIETARKNYGKFPVPSNFVESKKLSRTYTAEDKADLDIKTSVNKIGEIVNFSQHLNSLFWERIHKGESIEDCAELYEDICKMAVLSGVEIDRAKKEVNINSQKEIDKLSEKYRLDQDGKAVKPAFFKMITLENGFTLSGQTVYRAFDTPMDYLQRIVVAGNIEQAHAHKRRSIPFMDIIRKPESSNRGGNSVAQRDKILSLIQATYNDIQFLYLDFQKKEWSEKRKIDRQAAERMRECVEAVNKLTLGEYAMYLALREIDKNEKLSSLLFNTLFSIPNEAFYSLIKNSTEPLCRLQEFDKGDVKLYDFCYKKVYF